MLLKIYKVRSQRFKKKKRKKEKNLMFKKDVCVCVRLCEGYVYTYIHSEEIACLSEKWRKAILKPAQYKSKH